MSSDHIAISCVICTYNRVDMLSLAIESLCQQTLSLPMFEIIVVDNASTDSTRETVSHFQKEYPEHTIVYCYEAVQGLGHARNTGSKNARGKYVAFLDDDARAPENWLEEILNLFASVEPTPVCVGGPILPFYTSPKPPWFSDDYEIRTWGDTPRKLTQGESFSGSNMAWDKKTIDICGGFSVEDGVKGELLGVGEETSLFQRVWQVDSDSVLFYTPKIYVNHWTPPQKMHVSYFLKRAFVVGQSDGKNQIEQQSLSRRARLGTARVLLFRASQKLILSLPGLRKYPYWQRGVIDILTPFCSSVGRALSLLGIRPAIKHR